MSLIDSAIRALNTAGMTDYETTIFKATYPDENKAKEKHIETLIKMCNHVKPEYIVKMLGGRIRERDWAVTLKALSIAHRLTREANVRFFTACTVIPVFSGLKNYLDERSTNAWGQSRFIREYAAYLEEKCSTFKTVGRSIELLPAIDGGEWVKTLKFPKLKVVVPKLQSQFERLLRCDPYTDEGGIHEVAILGMLQLIKDGFRVYSVLTISVFQQLNRWKTMTKKEGLFFLEIYELFLKQTKLFKVWALKMVKCGLVDKEVLPDFDKLPENLIPTLTAYFKKSKKEETESEEEVEASEEEEVESEEEEEESEEEEEESSEDEKKKPKKSTKAIVKETKKETKKVAKAEVAKPTEKVKASKAEPIKPVVVEDDFLGLSKPAKTVKKSAPVAESSEAESSESEEETPVVSKKKTVISKKVVSEEDVKPVKKVTKKEKKEETSEEDEAPKKVTKTTKKVVEAEPEVKLVKKTVAKVEEKKVTKKVVKKEESSSEEEEEESPKPVKKSTKEEVKKVSKKVAKVESEEEEEEVPKKSSNKKVSRKQVVVPDSSDDEPAVKQQPLDIDDLFGSGGKAVSTKSTPIIESEEDKPVEKPVESAKKTKPIKKVVVQDDDLDIL